MERLTDQELETLLNELESDRVERKESFSGDVPAKARQAVCAFANDLPNHNQPGILFIGAKDNGQPSNAEITDQLLINLANIKTDGKILPLPVFSVEKRILKGADIAVVTVIYLPICRRSSLTDVLGFEQVPAVPLPMNKRNVS